MPPEVRVRRSRDIVVYPTKYSLGMDVDDFAGEQGMVWEYKLKQCEPVTEEMSQSVTTDRDSKFTNSNNSVTTDVAPHDELISVLSFTIIFKCVGASPFYITLQPVFKPADSPSKTGRWLAFTRMWTRLLASLGTTMVSCSTFYYVYHLLITTRRI